jgi:hypothetical protein
MKDILIRPHFTISEFNRLVRCSMDNFMATESGGRHHGVWPEIGCLTEFMVASSLSASECMGLRQGDLEFPQGQARDNPLLIHVPPIRRPELLVQAEPLGTDVADVVIWDHGPDRGGYLFEPMTSNREAALEFVTGAFNLLLDDTDLHLDRWGRARSIDSLVGTSLLFRAFGDTPFDLIANAAGISRLELDAFHDLHLGSESAPEAL